MYTGIHTVQTYMYICTHTHLYTDVIHYIYSSVHNVSWSFTRYAVFTVRRVCMHVYIYKYMYAYINTGHVCACVYTCWALVCVCVCVYVCLCVCMCMCVFVGVYICICIRVCKYIYAYIYLYTDTYICIRIYIRIYRMLQHNEPHCSTLQHTATHCNTLQHTATHCNTREDTCKRILSDVSVYISTWTLVRVRIKFECVAVCCSVLQSVAVNGCIRSHIDFIYDFDHPYTYRVGP